MEEPYYDESINPEPEEPPRTSWDDLLEALTLLRRSNPTVFSPFHCEHDALWVNAEPGDFTPEELARLDELGFHPNTEWGMGFTSYRFGSA